MGRRAYNRILVVFAAFGLVLAACGDDDDSPDAGGDGSADSNDATPVDDTGTEAPSSSAGSGAGTISLANGETFEFSLMCVLEPQEAAGQEILFSISSFDEPVYLDATKFGEDSVSPGLSSVSLYEPDGVNELWAAVDIDGSGGLLELDGTRVTGQGSFYPGGDVMGEAVDGTVDLNC